MLRGMFTLAHGLIVFTLFKPDISRWSDFLVPLVSLFASHGVSYYTNFIGRREYEQVSPGTLFLEPYSRILVMQLTIVLSGFAVASFGFSLPTLFVMIALKTAVDLAYHLKERKKFGGALGLARAGT